MRTAIYRGKKDILLTEKETPEAGDYDIVVKNLYSSICGTECGGLYAWSWHGAPDNGREKNLDDEMVSEDVQGWKERKGGFMWEIGYIRIRCWQRGIRSVARNSRRIFGIYTDPESRIE